MGKLMLNNINYTGGSGGTNVVPNPPETATDDLTSIKIDNTVYNLAGGSNVYGAFIDTNRIIQTQTPVPANSSVTYTATEDCFLIAMLARSSTADSYVAVNGVTVLRNRSDGNTFSNICGHVYLKKGDVATIKSGSADTSTNYTIYGLTFGTNNIFTPQIFSPEEREIGVWMDNKPLYCKTVYFDNVPKSSWTTLSLGLDVNDMIVNYGGVIITNNGVTWHLDHGGNNVFQSYIDTNNGICLYWTYGASSAEAYVTVYYTKSTDVPGSGQYNTLGVPMVHIEDNVETVIGTYNGKPLYQMKTSFTVNTTQQLNGFYRGDADLSSVMPTDIDRVLETSSNMQNPNSASRGFITSWYESDTQSLFYLCLFSVSGNTGHTIIKYTKTTD